MGTLTLVQSCDVIWRIVILERVALTIRLAIVGNPPA